MKRRLTKLAIFLLLGAVVNVAVAWGCATWIDVHGRGRRFASGQIPFERSAWFATVHRKAGAIRITSAVVPGASLARAREQLGVNASRAELERVIEERYAATHGPGSLQQIRRELPKWSRAAAPPPDEPQFPSYSIQDARGWPLATLWCEIDYHTILVRQGDHPALMNDLGVTFVVLDDRIVVKDDDGNVLSEMMLARGDAVAGGVLLPIRNRVVGVYDLRALPMRPLWLGFAINTIFYAAILWPLICGPFVLRRLIRRKRGLCVACGYDIRHADHDACPECGAVSGPSAETNGYSN